MHQRTPDRAARYPLLALLCAMGVASLAHAQLDSHSAARARRANFDAMLESYKVVKNQLKRDRADIAAIRDASARMAGLAKRLPSWFPAGSGQASGANTNARAEIWNDPTGFRGKAATMLETADRLNAAALAGNLAQIRLEQQAVSAACTACHKGYEDRF